MDSPTKASSSHRRRRRNSLRADFDASLQRYGLSMRKLVLGLVGLLIVGIAMFMARPPDAADIISEHVHYGWFKRNLIDDQLEKWHAASVTENGFLHPGLDRQWQRVGPATATPVTQSRLLYVMTNGYEVTREPYYLDAMDRGADFMLTHMRNPKDNRWVHEVDSTGNITNGDNLAHDEVIAMFALAKVYRLSRQERYRDAAVQIWEQADWEELLAARAFASGQQLDSSLPEGTRQNLTILLRLFEGLLALCEISHEPRLREDVKAVAHFISKRLYQADTQRLAWLYDRHWQPLSANEGGYISIGHQLEWAYLLSHAIDQGLIENTHLPLAVGLLEQALQLGYDHEQGGVIESVHYDASSNSRGKPAWVQASLLRALLHFAGMHDRQDLWPYFDQTFAMVKRDYMDTVYGGWYQAAKSKSADPNVLHKSDAQSCGFHVMNFYREALQLHEQRFLATQSASR